MIKIKRVYETPSKTDGIRVLVDRLWPRGVSKEFASIAVWEKDVAPSNELRKWFSHDPMKFEKFRTLYFMELEDNDKILKNFLEKIKHKKFTLVYAAKDTKYNHVICLKEFLEKSYHL